ncbi:MAG: aminopeptidase P family protein, partial [Desulfamplus sp.]|nr:aminopeptidase P family protein [Desulfamplus sp.]
MVPFGAEEYRNRLNRIREQMVMEKINLLFVTSPEGMCYLHGYQANWYQANSPEVWPSLSGTAVHVDHDKIIHFDFIDEKNLLKATSIVEDIRFYPTFSLDGLSFMVKELNKEGWLKGCVGLEIGSYRPKRTLNLAMESAFINHGCKVKDSTALLKNVRSIKSKQEIKYIEEAARIVEAGHLAVRACLKPGMSELDLAAELNYAMMKQGGEQAGLILALRSGPLASFHGMPTRRVIRHGDLVVMDPCGVVNRYHANQARAYYIGNPPKELISRYKIAGDAFKLFGETAGANIAIATANKVMRQYYEEHGIWELRDWVGGYELGLSFPPDWVGEFLFSVEDEEPVGYFHAGMVTNFESTLQTFLIDTFIYEESGARVLSKLEPELIVID